METRIKATNSALKLTLVPLTSRPFMVIHDAFQYFENHFGLTPQGILSGGDNHRPGARKLARMRRQIIAQSPAQVCVFQEPQAPKSLARALVGGINAKVITLDPLGSSLNPGPDLYITLLTNIAQNMRSCILTH
jgi:zinc transport system substrate-binding protein